MRIEQVIAGLLDNAVKFSPPGTVIDVDLVQTSRDAFSLAVRDHGPGVPPELRGNLFTRFYHGQPTDQTGGMGLGLYISREITVLHGGTIEAEFPADGGGRFIVTLPTCLGEAGVCASS
jgi:signal transduction histidine kinase